MQQQRHPGLAEELFAPPPENDPGQVFGAADDDDDFAADQRAIDRLRGRDLGGRDSGGLDPVARAHAVNQGADRDLLSDF